MKQWFWSLVQNCVFEARNDVIMIGSNMEQIQTELIKSYHYRTTGFEGGAWKDHECPPGGFWVINTGGVPIFLKIDKYIFHTT